VEPTRAQDGYEVALGEGLTLCVTGRWVGSDPQSGPLYDYTFALNGVSERDLGYPDTDCIQKEQAMLKAEAHALLLAVQIASALGGQVVAAAPEEGA